MKKLLILLGLCVAMVASAEEKTVRIALLSDPHVSLKTNGPASKYGAHFEQVIEDVNTAKVDVVLIAGDLGNEGKLEEWQAFLKYIKKLKAPVLYVPGNHDVGHKFHSGKKEGTITVEKVKNYEYTMGASFFAKEKSGVRIIGLNSSLLGSGFDRETEQWKFLEKQLAKPIKIPTVVFMHYPLYLETVGEAGGIYYNTEPEPREHLLRLLQKGGVKTVLTGHLHHNLVKHYNGILMVSTEPISFGLPQGKQPEGWTLVTLPPTGEATYEVHNLTAP